MRGKPELTFPSVDMIAEGFVAGSSVVDDS
jgi:hypothetical protein